MRWQRSDIYIIRTQARTLCIRAHGPLLRTCRVKKASACRITDLEDYLTAIHILVPLFRVELAESAIKLLDLNRLLLFTTYCISVYVKAEIEL